MAEIITVQVSHATPVRSFLRALPMSAGSTVGDAIAQSGVLADFPEIDLQTHRVGSYGKLKTLDTLVREHDRVEIYRPLTADPGEARRQRVAKKAEVATGE
jgi:putative ubiquitin-RnfH superfamily antitoxin RatB of RatAB toxin-antitoxin module